MHFLLLKLAEQMLAAVPKNAVTVDAGLLSQICIKVNTYARLPSGAEKDTDLHETVHRQLLWDSVQGSACNPGPGKRRRNQGALPCM